MKKIIFLPLILFLFSMNVNAASMCSYKEQTELNSKSSNIKVSYEVVEDTIAFEDWSTKTEYLKINIYNVTSEFYVKVRNSYNDTEVIYSNTDAKDGIISFIWKNIDEVINFTTEVYTSNNTSCPDEKYKTIYLTTPRYNEYSTMAICSENSDSELCKKYVFFEKLERAEFYTKIEKYSTNNNNNEIDDGNNEINNGNFMDRVFDFINDNLIIILGGIGILIVLIIVIYRSKTKKQRELGL